MEAQPVVVLAGPRWTRALFAAWAQRPLPVLAPWALGSFALGAALLGAALAVALVRRGRAADVAAATLLTSVVAFPMVVCAASVEVFLTRYVV